MFGFGFPLTPGCGLRKVFQLFVHGSTIYRFHLSSTRVLLAVGEDMCAYPGTEVQQMHEMIDMHIGFLPEYDICRQRMHEMIDCLGFFFPVLLSSGRHCLVFIFEWNTHTIVPKHGRRFLPGYPGNALH